MRLSLMIASVGLLCPLAPMNRAFAQGVASKADLMQSAWDSTYMAPGGQQVQARIQFNGNGGTYDTASGQGRLSQLTYGFDTKPNGETFFQINGRWSFLGSSGPFVFSSAGTDRFQGRWNGDDGRSGRWTGQLVAAAGQDEPFEFTYTQWRFYPDRNYYLRTCKFGDGTYFHAIYKPSFTKDYVFCFNPYKKRYWCCCPTVNNPDFNVAGRSVNVFILILNIDDATTVENSAIPDNPPDHTQNSVPLKNANGQPIATLSDMPTDMPADIPPG